MHVHGARRPVCTMCVEAIVETKSAEELAALTDKGLREEAESVIYAAALMNGSRYAAEYHGRCDLVYAECAKRAKGIYQRAYNAVVRGEGRSGMASEVVEGSA